MTAYTIPVFSDQELTPRSVEVIRAVIDESFPEHDITLREGRGTDKKLLVFGRPPEWHKGTNVELIYTYSIAQIMSKANAATVLSAGIRNFIEEPETIPFEENNIIFVFPEESIFTWLDSKFDYTKATAIDIETSGNLGKEHTPEEVGLLSVAFYQEGLPPVVIVAWPEYDYIHAVQREAIAKLLVKFEYGIYHNGKFDIRVLNNLLGTDLVNSFDTMLAHHVLNIAAGDHKLKTLARRYLGAPEWEADISKYTKGGGHYERIPRELLAQYNGWDVYWTYKLWQFFAPQIMSDDNNIKAMRLEMAAAEFLLEVEVNGIPFDDEYAEELADKLEIDMGVLQEHLINLTGFSTFNPNSPQQVKKALGEKFGWHTSSTDEESLNEIITASAETSDVNKFCKTLLAYRKASKQRGTYALGWKSKSRHGRVHPTFLVHGTSTGRLSSTSPNAQNIPRDKKIRRLVKVNDG